MEDVHPDIAAFDGRIPHTAMDYPTLRTVVKAGFGFGDVNNCVAFRKWNHR